MTWNTNAAWVGGVQPTAADDVIIPASSSVTLPTATTCLGRSLTVQASGTLIWATTTSILALGDATAGAGNVALSISATATITLTGVGTLQFLSTSATQQTITTAGKVLPNVTFGGTGGSWQLQDALSIISNGTLTLTAGALNTNDKAVGAGALVSSGAVVKSLTLGASVVTLASNNTPMNLAGSNQTLSAGTSTINVTPTVNPGNWGFTSGFVWNDIIMAAAGVANVAPIRCVNFTRTCTAVKTNGMFLQGTMICSGVFTCTGNSAVNRLSLSTVTPGVGYGIVATSHVITNTDLMDISLVTYVAGSVIASDSFNRANSSLGGSSTDSAAGGSAAVWSSPSGGTWNIASNQVQTILPTNPTSVITVDAGVRNMAVEAKVGSLGASGNSSWQLVAAGVDANNFVTCKINQVGGIFIGYVLSGALVSFGTVSGVTIVVGDTVGIEVVGSVIILRRNGVIVSTASMPQAANAALQGTRAGLAGTNNNATISQFDDFKVSNCSPATTLTGCGDSLGNSNVVFTPNAGTSNGGNGVNRYWVGNAGTSSSTAQWSTSSGGAPGASVPLPQDDVYFDANSFTLNNQRAQFDMPRICRNFDTTGTTRTGTTVGGSSGVNNAIYGNLNIQDAAHIDGNSTGGFTFAGRGNHTIHSNGLQYGSLVWSAPGGTYTLTDDCKEFVSNKTFNFSYGTFDTAGFNVAAQTFTIAVTMTSVKAGYGSFWDMQLGASGTGFTNSAPAGVFQAQTSTISVLGASGSVVFSGGVGTYYNVRNVAAPTASGSSPQLTVSGASYIDTLSVSPGKVLTFTSNVLQTVGNLVASGSPFGYQYLNSTSGNYVSVPDSAATSWTGDFDYRFKLSAESWAQNNMSISAKQTNGSSGLSWSVSFNATSKQPSLSLSSNGTSATVATSTVAVPFADGAAGWLRVTRRVSDGRVQFFTSTDPTNDPSVPTWTQLGADRTANVGALFDSPASILIGALNTSNSPVFNGKFYRAQYRNNILDNGTGIQLDVDFTTKAFGANTFTESSANAATVTINGSYAQAGDGRVAVTSSSAGTQAFVELVGPYDTFDYQTIQDIYSTIPYKYYAGANSLLVSNTSNIVASVIPVGQSYIARQYENTFSAVPSGATLPFGQTVSAGSLLVVLFGSFSLPGTVTGPSGFTLVDTNNASNAGYSYIWYKVASGGETAVSFTASNNVSHLVKIIEIAGFTGTPTIDVKEKNNSVSTTVTTLASGPGVSNTLSPGYTLAIWGGNAALGATVSITNGLLECRALTQSSVARIFGAPVSSVGSRSSTLTWTSATRAASQLVVFNYAIVAAGHMLSLMGVGS